MEQQARVQDTLYSPLNPESRQIRIFTLLPGVFTDPIKGFLTQVPLENNPDYEALSYVWGDPTVTLPIYLAASGPDSSNYVEFGVTANLESALRHLRLKNVSRRLWIDAICINQSDILERNHQVKNMKWIYEAASRVVVWLGKFNVYSSQGLKLLLDIMTKEHVFDIIHDLTFTQHCISDILGRDYWQRIWVVQEFALANRILIVCGPFAIEMPAGGYHERAKRNIQSLEQKATEASALFGPSFTKLLHILEIKEERRLSRASPLWELVWRFRPCKSRDPRDKVFALLGLVSDSDLLENNPDYSLDFEMVRYRFIHSSIQRQGNLHLLNLANRPSSVAGHPSWLFDWSKTDVEHAWEELHGCSFVPFDSSRRSRFRNFEASRAHRPILTGPISDPRLLTMGGFTTDLIDYLGPRYDYNPQEIRPAVTKGVPRLRSSTIWTMSQHLWRRFVSQRPTLQQWNNQILLDFKAKAVSSYASPDEASFEEMDNIREAFWRTIIADSIVEGSADFPAVNDRSQSSHGTRPDKKFCRIGEIFTNNDKLVRDIESEFETSGGKPHYDFVRAIESAIADRLFFLSDSGWMGLAPAAAMKGDLVCILIGGATPFVLRPVGESFYQLIGECYVHGMMDGEAMDHLSNGRYELRDITLV